MITIYTTKTCVYCPMVKRLYDSKGIKYQVVELDDRPDLRNRIIEKTGFMTVPVTTDGTTYIPGYNVHRLLEIAE